MVFRFQRIIPRHAEPRHTDMSNRHPPLQLVVPGAMKNIRNPNGSSGRSSFQTGKSRGIICDVVRNQDFSPSTRLKVAGRSVVEPTKYRHAGK